MSNLLDELLPEDYEYQEAASQELSEEVQSGVEDAVETSEVEQEMSEAERRFNKASLYKQWVSGRIFDGESEDVLEVEEEFRGFARTQLKKLIGLKDEDPKPEVISPFSPEEITALKTIAATLLKRPSFAKVEPTIPAKVELKPVPKRPVLRPRTVPPKPTVQKSEVIQRSAPKQPIAQAKTAVTKPAPAKLQAAAPASVPTHDSIIKKNGKTYKIVHLPTTHSEHGPGPSVWIRGLKAGASVILPGSGTKIYRDTDGSLYKIIEKDITPVVKPVDAVPMPHPSQMLQITSAMSERTHQAAERTGGYNQNGDANYPRPEVR
jgi:hypothetical protein